MRRERHLEQALAICDAVQDRELVFRFGQDVASPAMAYLAMTLWPLGVLDRAARSSRRRSRHALKTKHIPTIALCSCPCRNFRDDAARPLAGRATSCRRFLASPVSMRYRFGSHSARSTMAGCGRAPWIVRPVWRKCMRAWRSCVRSSNEIFMPLLMTLLAETEAEAGRPDAASPSSMSNLRPLSGPDSAGICQRLHRARGEILLKCRPRDEAAAESAFEVPSTSPEANRQNCSSFKPPSASGVYGWGRASVLTRVNWSHQSALGLMRGSTARPSRKQGYC